MNYKSRYASTPNGSGGLTWRRRENRAKLTQMATGGKKRTSCRHNSNNTRKFEDQRMLRKTTTLWGVLAILLGSLLCSGIATAQNTGSITGRKFHDLNGNSQFNGEPGLANFTINLHDGSSILQTATTNTQGFYSFNSLAAGLYTVHEEQKQNDFVAQTFPTTVYHTIDLLNGENRTGVDFGNDSLCDGDISWDSCLYGTEDNFVGPEFSYVSPEFAQWMTDNNSIPYDQFFDNGTHDQWFGHTFDSCWSDTCEVIQAELCLSIKSTGSGSHNDWIYIGDWSQDGRIWSASLTALWQDNGGSGDWGGGTGTEMVLCLDLENLPLNRPFGSDIIAAVQDGNIDILIEDDTEVDWIYMVVELCCDSSYLTDSLSSICGQKFHDVNGNHQLDGGEPGIQGFDINLLDGSYSIVATETTDYFGNYCFDYLPAGQYTVHEVSQPSLYTAHTFPTTVFHTINLLPSQSLTNIDFGNDSLCDGDVSYDSCLNGTEDNFVGPEFSYVSPEFAQWMTDNNSIPYDQFFDNGTNNRWFGHTFDSCWSDTCEVIAATLCMRIRTTGSGSSNDWIYLGDWSQDGRIWSASLTDLWQWSGGSGQWTGQEMILCLDLENLPLNRPFGSDIIAAVQDGNLDILIEDDTEVDWINMVVELCCDTACGDLGEVINTGWDQFSQQLIPQLGYDDDWRLIGTPGGPVDEPAWVTDQWPFGPYQSPTNSAWLGVMQDWNGAGDYVFEYTFCLDEGFSNAEFQFPWVIGSGTISVELNGNLVGGPHAGLLGWGFSTNDQNHFQAGQNSIRVILNDSVYGPEAAFALNGWIWADNGLCCDTGACCDSTQICYQTDQKTCLKDGGIFWGKNTDCVNIECDTCFADGDMNGDGIVLSVADFVHLAKFLVGQGGPPIPLYKGDLNADGYIDQLDAVLFECYFTSGILCFPTYPIPVDCNPSAIFGACCDPYQICTILSPDNCAAIGGTYAGDGTICAPIDPCGTPQCCINIRGNVNGDAGDNVDVSDLGFLVDYLFRGGAAPTCSTEANVDGDPDEQINVADLTYLVDYLFRGGNPPPPCDVPGVPAGKFRNDVILGYEYRDGSTVVSLESAIDIRGIMVELSGDMSDKPTSLLDDNFELLYDLENSSEARLGLVDLTGLSIIKAGTHQLVSIPGEHEITSAVLSDENHHTVIPAIEMVAKGSGLPTQFSLNQNHPNPFNPSTSIAFSLPSASAVRLEVFNVLGRKVATLADRRFEAGDHAVAWDASTVSSGLYLYRLTAGDFTETKKMLLLK